MNSRDTLLVEIGTEELPPDSLALLGEAFAEQLFKALENARFVHAAASSRQAFYTPRRLAVVISGVSAQQRDQVTLRKGPLLAQAFDAAGKPTAAAEGFARSCGVSVRQLVRSEENGRLLYQLRQAGAPLAAALTTALADVAAALPIPQRMRWGAHRHAFVRPVRWLCVVYAGRALDCGLFDIVADNITCAHRFHCPQPLTVHHANAYSDCLRRGKVVADFVERRRMIAAALQKISRGRVLFDEAGLNEAAALTEYPQVLCGEFETRFLALPNEVVQCILRRALRVFPIEDQNGVLQPCFAIVSNTASKNPEEIVCGYQRVAQPRLADAAFFLDRDQEIPLPQRCRELSGIVFAKKLGTLDDKLRRIIKTVRLLAPACSADEHIAVRSAQLCKCDLTTDMVREYPELEGIMGRHYALAAQEPRAVAVAIAEHYRPRHAQDALPASAAGMALALADKLDTVTGLFAVDQAPTGTKDPFALRRKALGIIRILVEKAIALDLRQFICTSLHLHSIDIDDAVVVEQITAFFIERIKRYALDHSYSGDCVVAAFSAMKTFDPLDLWRRLQAVEHFTRMPFAESLARSNKRIWNLLKRTSHCAAPPQPEQFVQAEEKHLFQAAQDCAVRTRDMIARADYLAAIGELVKLHTPIDDFFDAVLVMSDDVQQREARLRLLLYVGGLFRQIADFSKIATVRNTG